MSKVAHVIGNGDMAAMYKPAKGIKVTCNLPPFAVENVFSTFMVDFKMMKAIDEGSVIVPGEWILGARPKKWMEIRPDFYMKYAPQIKGFYLHLPKYVSTYTDFNCGHMATHYVASKMQATEIHMYGFDSMFEFNMRSTTDLFLHSDRSNMNNNRLISNWRPIWSKLFEEFPETQFVLYHKHDNIKFTVPKNVEIRTKN